MITILQQPPKWSSIYREIWYRFKRQYIQPTGTYIVEDAGGGDYNFYSTLTSYVSVGDIVILTDSLGKVSKFKCISNNGANIVIINLIETESTSSLASFTDCTVIKKGKITANIYAGYRRGLTGTFPKIEKYAGVVVYPDDDGVYAVRVDGFLRSYLEETQSPAISTIDKSLFLHYFLRVIEPGFVNDVAVDSIKCGLNGSVVDVNSTEYVLSQLQLNDAVVKNINSYAFVSNISDDVVVNTILDSEYVPPPDAGGGSGGDVNVKRSDTTTIASVTAPADYTVADTAVRLKDSSGATISTTNVKAASSFVDINAPDATVNLNGAAFLTPKSGQTINATLVDENDVTVTPNVTGSKITVPYDSAFYPLLIIKMHLFNTGNYI